MIVARSILPQREANRGFREPFYDQLSNHLHETRVRSHSSGSRHRESNFIADLRRLIVEVIKDFEVIRDKADRCDDDRACLLLFSNFAQRIADIRF